MAEGVVKAPFSTSQEGNDVRTPTAIYFDLAARWRLPRTLWGGTPAMQFAGKEYLPQWPAETDEDYDARLKATTLYNAFRKAVQSLAGRLFSQPIAFGEGMDEEMQSWMENVDLQGRNLERFSWDVFCDAAVTGMSHILVEMQTPPADEETGLPVVLDQVTEKELGRRPYFVHYRAEDVIGWRTGEINGKEALVQVRLLERFRKDAGAYDVRFVERVRVLTPGAWEVWENLGSADKPQWQKMGAGTTSLDYIPLHTFYTNRIGVLEALPPLEDLAHLNLTHYQSSSDQRTILHFARVPILFGVGLDDADAEAKTVGAGVFFTSANPNAKLEVIEHSGAAIQAGAADLQELEARMAALAMEPMLPNSGRITATATAVNTADVTSILQAWALSLEDALECCLETMADFTGKDREKSADLEVNKDFGLDLANAQNADVIMKLNIAGKLSNQTTWEQLQSLRTFTEDFDPELEQQRLDEEGAARGDAGGGGPLPLPFGTQPFGGGGMPAGGGSPARGTEQAANKGAAMGRGMPPMKGAA